MNFKTAAYLILAACLCGAATANEPLQLASFQIDATPPLGSPLCNGNVKPAMEIVSPLTARGIVLLGSGEPIVLCAFDWVGIGNESYDRFREAVAAAVGTKAERVALHCLHQHDAPGSDFATERLLNKHGIVGKCYNADFDAVVMERLAAAAKKCLKKTTPITHVGLAAAKVEKVASNRRILGKDGKVAIVRLSRTNNKAAIEAPEGTIDPLLRTISLWNEDRPVACISYYATHPQSYYGAGSVNWDFVGIARKSREEALPDVVQLYFDGAGGNVAAGKYNTGAKENRAVLASRVEAAMKKAWESQERHAITPADIQWRVEKVSLPIRDTLVQDELIAKLKNESLDLKVRMRAGRDLTFVRRMKAGTKIPLTCLQLGPARVLHMPGELFVEYQLAAQKMRPDDFIAMAAYGDFGPGYIGTKIAYGQGGYETGRVSRVAPTVEGVLMKGIKKLLADEDNQDDQPCDDTQATAEPERKKPNILLITCDNLGYGDLKPFNSKATIQSPNLNALAKQGATLKSFYTASSTCTVSRACLLTGRIAQRHGLVNQLPGVKGNYGVGLNPHEVLIPQVLKSAKPAYATGCFGKWNIGFAKGSRPTERGFDEFIGHASGNMDYYRHNYRERHDLYDGVKALHREGEYATDLFADAAIDFMNRNSKAGKPWFCYLPFNAPHFPMAGNKRGDQPNQWQAPDEAFNALGLSPDEKDPRKRYEVVVYWLDRAIGRILASLKKNGQEENTFVFFMSDNGAFDLNRKGLDVGDNTPLRSGGITCWEGGIRVAAIARWPGKIHAGSLIDTPFWSPDLLVACAKLARAPLPEGVQLDGKNPLPLLTMLAPSPHKTFYFSFRQHSALRKGEWKIVREKPNAPWRLFNLIDDIAEKNNLAKENTDTVDELNRDFTKWEESFN